MTDDGDGFRYKMLSLRESARGDRARARVQTPGPAAAAAMRRTALSLPQRPGHCAAAGAATQSLPGLTVPTSRDSPGRG